MSPAQSRRLTPAGFFAWIAIIAVLDVWSKSAMLAWLAPARRSIEVTPFLNLRLGFNPGVSFGLFPAETELARASLIGFAVVATLLVVWLGLKSHATVERASFASIAGGAIGNIVDRYADGFVTDFLDLHAFGWHWPTFNLADVAITCGVIALLATTVLGNRAEPASQDHTP